MFRIVFWDVLPCKIIVEWRFRGTCCLHQGRMIIPDDGGSTYLWNVGRQLFYTAVHPIRQFWTSYSPPWEPEISHTDDCLRPLRMIMLLFVRFQVLTEASMKFRVSRDVAPCSHFEVDRRLRGTYCLHHQCYIPQHKKLQWCYLSVE
jgi:hypothetical protein